MKSITTILLLIICIPAFASNWISPTEQKYKTAFPDLYELYIKSRVALDSYSGKRETLIEAKKLLDEILYKNNKFAPAYREYGRLFIKAGHISYSNFQEGSLGSAESAILEAIEIEPDYADAYVLLGHLYTQNKHYKKAENALKKAESLGTKLPWFHLNYADLLKRLNRYDEVLPHYMSVINSNTDNKNAYGYALSSIAIYYRKTREFDKAIRWFEKSVKFNPSAWNYGEYAAFLLFWAGDTSGSIEKGEKALSIMEYGLGKFHLSCAYYTKWSELLEKSPIMAKQYFDKAFKLYPYTEKVIQKMIRYPTTKKAANELIKISELTSGSSGT